jgi:hypothetical protein
VPKRDDLDPMERAVSDALDHVNHACHGLTSSWAYPEEFLEQLGDTGFDVVATVDLDELRRTAGRADVLARGHADLYGDYQAAQQRAERAEADLRAVYRERARLVAYLAARFPSFVVTNPDDDEWPIIYITTPQGQLSWHLARADLDLFSHVRSEPWEVEWAAWDGHTTEEKYRRLAELTRREAARD